MQLQKPVLRHELTFRLTPQLYQAIKIMALPIQDLRLKIREELDKNPALEEIEDNTVVSLEDISQNDGDDYGPFDESSDPGFSRSKGQEASDAKRQFMEGTLSRPESLQDHLLWQLRLQTIDQELFSVGEMLIHNLDENGFHREDPELLIKEDQKHLLIEALELIRGFDPPGTCTKDYKESLLVQIRIHPDPHPKSYEAVERHLELLEKKKYDQVAKKMKIEEGDIHDILEFLKVLDPMPGRNFATDQPQYVIPDVMVKVKQGDFVIILNDEEIPVLGINPFFNNIERNHSNEKSVSKFVHSQVNDAKSFIRSIGQRNETLLKTCKVIVEFQRDFFRNGPKYLRPLTLKDIADEIEVHESTVSRIANSKYMQTEWGIFSLKYFFTNSADGSQTSKVAVKEHMLEIIQAEGNTKLTDMRIKEKLDERGIPISRRTVAKYRKELEIESSFQR